MLAGVINEDRELEVREVDDPSAGPNQLRLRVDFAGICGSDLHALELLPPGAILGHEFVGTVDTVGAGVERFSLGDRVCAVPAVGCDHCIYCLSGDPIHCASALAIGGQFGGAFSQFVVTSALQSVHVPESVPDDIAALTEPLSVGLKVFTRAQLKPGDRLLVLGAGPIGLAVTLWAHHHAVGDVLVSDPIASRRDLALKVGATAVVDPTVENLTDACVRELGGLPEVVIECVGRPGMANIAAEAIAPYGRLVLAGFYLEEEQFGRFTPLFKEISIEFPNFTVRQGFKHTLNLLGQGRIDPSPLISHRVGLDELPAMMRALRTPNEFGKVLVSPADTVPASKQESGRREALTGMSG